MAKKTAKDDAPTFAEARARLDEILDEVEGDDIDVDQLAARVREASGLIKLCRDRLASARQEVTKIVAELQTEAKPEAKPEPEPGAEAEDDDAGGLPF